MESDSTVAGFQSLASTIDTIPVASPWNNVDNLNFDKGLAGEFTIDILQHVVKKDKVQETLSNRYKDGRTTRDKIDKTLKLSGRNM